MAFNSQTTIYPVVSDRSTGMPTTVYPYLMRNEDAPKGNLKRSAKILRTTNESNDGYVAFVEAKIRSFGGYESWLGELERVSPSTISVIIGGTVEENRNARAQAQRNYDVAKGVNTSGGVSAGSLADELDAIGDAASDAASSVGTYVQANPGKTVAWIAGAGLVVWLLARSGRR